MTSKEFTRRCEFFVVFNKAAELFFTCKNLVYIYKFSSYGKSLSSYGNSLSSESYGVSLHDFYDFLNSLSFSFDLVYLERYSLSQFKSSFKYFLSFLSRLSDRQMSILVSSGRFDYLFKFKDESL